MRNLVHRSLDEHPMPTLRSVVNVVTAPAVATVSAVICSTQPVMRQYTANGSHPAPKIVEESESVQNHRVDAEVVPSLQHDAHRCSTWILFHESGTHIIR